LAFWYLFDIKRKRQKPTDLISTGWQPTDKKSTGQTSGITLNACLD